MIHPRRSPKRLPKHARPSLLAPTRTLAVLAGFGVLSVAAVAAVAGCAAATQHGAGAPAGRPARIVLAPVEAAAFAQRATGPAVLGAGGAPAKAALIAAARPGAPGARTGGAGGAPDGAPVSGLAASGIPSTALSAYEKAAAREAARQPGCGIGWPLLAGIGRVESNHGRFAGAVLHADGVSTPRIIGIPLDGHGTALIRDTDRGRLDGDAVYDRAVGPMQFIPSTWSAWGVDANGDGVRDPFNIFDAAAAAADYLCAAGRDLTTTDGQVRAILSYNHSYAYVSTVMGLERIYARQTGLTVPVLPTAPTGPGSGHQTLPPVDPGRPGGLNGGLNGGLTQAGAPHRPGKPLPVTSSPATSPATGSASGSSSGSSSESEAGSSPGSSSSTASGPTPAPSTSSSTAPPSCPAPSTSSSGGTSASDAGTAAADPCASDPASDGSAAGEAASGSAAP